MSLLKCQFEKVLQKKKNSPKLLIKAQLINQQILRIFILNPTLFHKNKNPLIPSKLFCLRFEYENISYKHLNFRAHIVF